MSPAATVAVPPLLTVIPPAVATNVVASKVTPLATVSLEEVVPFKFIVPLVREVKVTFASLEMLMVPA